MEGKQKEVYDVLVDIISGLVNGRYGQGDDADCDEVLTDITKHEAMDRAFWRKVDVSERGKP